MDSTIRTFKGLEMNEMVIGFTMLGVYVLFGLIVLVIALYIANRLTPIKKGDDQEIREHWETRGKTTFTGAEYVSDSWVETTTVGAKRVGSRFVPIILLFGFLCYMFWGYIDPILEWATYWLLKIIAFFI